MMLIVPLLLLILVPVIAYCIFNYSYKKCSYYQITSFPLISVITDKGRLGEYMTYKQLKSYEKQGAKFLFNVYIPKENEETTEIDIIMLCRKGIFVFESKNYSGWIFGSEWQKNWYQTLPVGRGKSRKESFYNPIMQNKSHIKHLKNLIGKNVSVWSIIVFSERCTLKNVNVTSNDIAVINRNQVLVAVSAALKNNTDSLSDMEVIDAYNKLLPYTKVDYALKQQHVLNIQRNYIESIDPMEMNELQKESTNKALKCNVMTIQDETLKCPKCGAALVLREAKKGGNIGKEFYGCSNFPKCRYIKNKEII